MEPERQIEEGVGDPGQEKDDEDEDAERLEDDSERRLLLGEPAEEAATENDPDHDAETSSRGQRAHPEEVLEHPAIDHVARLEGLDDTLACPVELGIEAQGLAKVLLGLAVLSLAQIDPTAIGVREGAVRVELESLLGNARGLVLAVELLEAVAAEIDAVDVFRIAGEPLPGRGERRLPLLLPGEDLGLERPGVGIFGLEEDDLLGCVEGRRQT